MSSRTTTCWPTREARDPPGASGAFSGSSRQRHKRRGVPATSRMVLRAPLRAEPTHVVLNVLPHDAQNAGFVSRRGGAVSGWGNRLREGVPPGCASPHYATASRSRAASHAEPRSRQSGHRGLNGPAQCRDHRSTLFPRVGSGSPPKRGPSERSPRASASIRGNVARLQRRCSGFAGRLRSSSSWAQIPRCARRDRLAAAPAIDLPGPHLRRPPLAEPLVLPPVAPGDRATRHHFRPRRRALLDRSR
jgi:hypothetical protein